MSIFTDRIMRIIPDKLYIQIKYFYRFHKFANIDNPKTYNEKLQWMKLYDRNPLYTKLCDKYEVKDYVKDIIGEEYLIPTIGIYNSFEEIDFDKLPNQFVIKCTHDSGGLVICKDKNIFDYNKARNIINNSLKTNYYWHSREWPYKNVKPRIIIEKYMEDDSGELRDYKFFCFDGNVKALYVASERYSDQETKFTFFDENFNRLDLYNSHPSSKEEINKPETFEKMKNIASKLSKGFNQVRVDLYEIEGKVYFGEMTFFHMSGFQPFIPEKWDYIFGEWFKINNY